MAQPGGIDDTLKIKKLSYSETVARLEDTKLNSSAILSGRAINSSGVSVGHMVTVTKIGGNPSKFVVNEVLFPVISKNGSDIMRSQEVVDFMTERLNSSTTPESGEYTNNSYTILAE